ncbi:type II toxin-antitoxin system VapC family toxin [Xanthomonas arboricola]|uniref:type II toxin-antitoxin system VapC family toxin n=1 Tax=Xanthomonas arboricola TaxID=56448 RepID=UPI000CEEA847|nr:PIN domain-containing protein [Xanthomonas arboricola]PPU22612.1 PIN domain-containing protein [Xanthomonas arboricola pv. guizotiae]
MTRAILLDANLLIGALDTDPNNSVHLSAKAEVERLLTDDRVRVAISPLIRYEVLRGAKRVPLDELEQILNAFQEFEVGAKDARMAAEVFRHDRRDDAERAIDKKRFDVFHCVCANLNDLELISHDQDIKKIQDLIKELEENAKAHRP